MTRYRQAALLVGSIAILCVGTAHALTPVVSCGQTIRDDAELTGDLDCSSQPPGTSLILEGGLALNGHTFTGTPDPDPSALWTSAVVHCPRGCSILGPGVIRGGWNGVSAANNLTLKNVDLVDNTAVGASAAGKLTASGVVATGNELGLSARVLDVVASNVDANVATGIACVRDASSHGGTCRVADSTVNGNGGVGIEADKRLTTSGTTVSGNGGNGVTTSFLRMDGCVVTSNASTGALAYTRARVGSSEVHDNDIGVAGGYRLVLVDSVVSANRSAGLDFSNFGPSGYRFIVRGSNVSSNCVAPSQIYCADLRTCAVPTVTESTCETSADPCNGGTSYGFCSLD